MPREFGLGCSVCEEHTKQASVHVRFVVVHFTALEVNSLPEPMPTQCSSCGHFTANNSPLKPQLLTGINFTHIRVDQFYEKHGGNIAIRVLFGGSQGDSRGVQVPTSSIAFLMLSRNGESPTSGVLSHICSHWNSELTNHTQVAMNQQQEPHNGNIS